MNRMNEYLRSEFLKEVRNYKISTLAIQISHILHSSYILSGNHFLLSAYNNRTSDSFMRETIRNLELKDVTFELEQDKLFITITLDNNEETDK